ncbi:LysR family transcriptional regulator [Roseiarcaceae bacterium H3SJ34-1]|uniref:LysR family transcriptional regulator n=1 Tax=Terripilifer ovatus TaxID=3032367 RepID=UPI003AB9536B|nr:LysR family transcriptional regulator [Roseiarcaceae bacterium H3SJ34-1]
MSISASGRRLDVFRAIIERGGVNAAADWLGISQPSVTAHVRALEKELGASLFLRRRGHKNEPTAAGEALFSYACQSASHRTELSDQLRRLGAESVNVLSIAVQRNVANYAMPRGLASFLRTNPAARISIHSETQEAVADLYKSGRVDAAILFADGSLSDTPLIIGRQKLVLVANAGHPLARRRNIPVEDLAAYAFVGSLDKSRFSGLIRRALNSIGLRDYRVILHLQDSVAVKNAALHGIGIACTLWNVVETEVSDGRLVLLDIRQQLPSLLVEAVVRPNIDSIGLWQSLLETLKRELVVP